MVCKCKGVIRDHESNTEKGANHSHSDLTFIRYARSVHDQAFVLSSYPFLFSRSLITQLHALVRQRYIERYLRGAMLPLLFGNLLRGMGTYLKCPNFIRTEDRDRMT